MRFLRLVRFPLLFTAWADVSAGYLLALSFQGRLGRFELSELLLLWVASGGLYAAGMALNDCFDLERDAVLHPRRVLPAGKLSLTAAFLTAFFLAFLGLLASALLGTLALYAACFIVLLVWLYDSRLKELPALGALALALCRAFNFFLGEAASPEVLYFLPARDLLLPLLILGLYVFFLSRMARYEHAGGERLPPEGAPKGLLLSAGAMVALLFLSSLLYLETLPARLLALAGALALTLLVYLVLKRMLSPERMLSISLLFIIPLDAALALNGPELPLLWGGALLLLIIPFYLSNRVLSVT